MTTTTNIDLIVDAIDWESFRSNRPAHRDPDLQISTTSFRKPPRAFPIPKTGCALRKPWHSIKPA